MKKTSRNIPGGTPATQTLYRAGVSFTVHTFEAENSGTRSGYGKSGKPRYGRAAAEALGVEHDRVFKTLVVSLQGSRYEVAVAVVPVNRQLSLKALATTLEAKRAELLEPAEAERITGYVLGGISPLGQRRHLPTVIDCSAFSWKTIFVSAGQRGTDIELSPTDFIRILRATTAAISGRSKLPSRTGFENELWLNRGA